eukprot:TRINITY_DN6499_c0_g1_i1.p1 TRINITY_DN6499_c0_g1~~TRINITY_DN6499_c0_g1_i1.p1  ORF type:complete len:289 (+),score=75.68 TRINITY_DN6499_c0_g1_i1:20-886(+)
MTDLYDELYTPVDDVLVSLDENNGNLSLKIATGDIKSVDGTVSFRSSFAKNGNSFSSELSPTLTVNDHVSLSGTFSTDNEFKTQVNLQNLWVDNSELSVGTLCDQTSSSLNIDFTLKREQFSVATSYQSNGENMELSGSAVVKMMGCLLGSKVKVIGEEKSYSLGASIPIENGSALFSSEDGKNFKLGYTQEIEKGTAAVEWNFDSERNSTVSAGFKTTLDGLSELKSRITSINTTDIRFGFSYSQKLEDWCSIKVGADLNSKKLLSTAHLIPKSADHKFSLELNLLD